MKDDRPLFAYKKKKSFIVSDKSDEELQKHLKNYFLLLAILCGVFLAGMIVGLIFALK